MTCDHQASRSSLNVFTASTKIIGVQADGDGGWMLLGNCYGCGTTLAIDITEKRSRVVSGELGACSCEADAGVLERGATCLDCGHKTPRPDPAGDDPRIS